MFAVVIVYFATVAVVLTLFCCKLAAFSKPRSGISLLFRHGLFKSYVYPYKLIFCLPICFLAANFIEPLSAYVLIKQYVPIADHQVLCTVVNCRSF